MAGTMTHLVIAEKIYYILGNEVIKNLPLFFGGNIAPDAIHAKKDYQRIDKLRTHLRDGIRSYGYAHPEDAKLFKERTNNFIEKYYLPAGEEKDLYLGYIIHIFADELYFFEYFDQLENNLKNERNDMNISDFRKIIADRVKNNEFNSFFDGMVKIYDILPHEYKFMQNIVNILDSTWDYEIKDYISVSELNASKRRVIKKFDKISLPCENIITNDRGKVLKFLDSVVYNIVERLKHII